MNSYHQSTKSSYAPIISLAKREEVNQRKRSLEMPAKEKYKNLNSDQEEKKRIYEERMKVYQSLPPKQSMTPRMEKHTASVDYLQELRSKRTNESNTYRRPKYDWKAELSKKNVENSIKEQRIKEKAKVLHQEALHKERMLKIQNNDLQPEEIDQMNDLLFQSLEAKLSVLNEFSQS